MKKLEFSQEKKDKILGIMENHSYPELTFYLEPTDKDIEYLDKYPEQTKELMKIFQEEVYPHPADHEEYDWEDTDFNGFVVGFLCAKGIPPLDAFLMNSFFRYHLQYFE